VSTSPARPDSRFGKLRALVALGAGVDRLDVVVVVRARRVSAGGEVVVALETKPVSRKHHRSKRQRVERRSVYFNVRLFVRRFVLSHDRDGRD